MSKTSFVLLGFWGFALSASAASFVTVQCSPPLGSPVTTISTENSTSCSGGALYPSHNGYASVAGSVVLSLAADATQYSTLTTGMNSYIQQASLSDPVNPTYMPGGSVQASINYRTLVATSGPIRSGYLELDYTDSSNFFYDGYAQSTIGIQVPNSPLITNISCGTNPDPFGNCSPGLTYYQRFGLIPVTLGSSYILSATGTLNNVADGFDGDSGGFLNLTYRFRFLEADQAMPVQVFLASDTTDVPEPSTWALLIAGGVLYSLKFKFK